MKKTLLALTLAVLLMLSGCSSILARAYVSVSPHPDHPTTAEDPRILKAENYQQLVNGILSFVSGRMDSGVIRLTNYMRDVEADLNEACLEVANFDPLGAYAVDFIKSDYTRVVKYYEANINITYRRTPEQIQSIVNVTGSTAIREELGEKLSAFSPEAVLRVGYFIEDRDYITSLVNQAYYDTPATAMGMPQFTVSLYPKNSTGRERIVEITLSYPDDPEVLHRKSAELIRQVNSLGGDLAGLKDGTAADAIFHLLQARVTRLTAGGVPGVSTAYSALIGNRADSEGIALAFQLLAQAPQLESNIVQGTRNGVACFWNMVHLSVGGWRHIDATGSDGALLTDIELSALGYDWARADYPASGPAVPMETTPAVRILGSKK